MERDFYPEGEKAPGVDGSFREWIPGPEVKSNITKPKMSEKEALKDALASMGDAVPYQKTNKE